MSSLLGTVGNVPAASRPQSRSDIPHWRLADRPSVVLSGTEPD